MCPTLPGSAFWLGTDLFAVSPLCVGNKTEKLKAFVCISDSNEVAEKSSENVTSVKYFCLWLMLY